jgi:signal transduction histidine kinase
MVPLEASPLFKPLSAAELRVLQQAACERAFAAGEDIFREGDASDGIYLVKDGAVQISALVNKDRFVFSRIMPGDFFGEMTLLDSRPRSATATADLASTLVFIPRAPLLQLLENSPRLALALFQEISNRLRHFDHLYITKLLQFERMAIVGRFAASIVHDLRNPLTIITILTDFALQQSPTPESRDSAVRVRRQVERINNLVNDIMEFTKTGSAPVELIPVNYATFVSGVIEEQRAETSVKSVTITFENPPPDVELRLHPQRLGRVFYNLINNAAEAMPYGGEIKLRFQTTDKAVITEIEDAGPGLAREILDRLFEAFATFGKAHGTGLGLSLSKKIVEEHQGEISARNRPGGGAIFSFTLPRPRLDAKG